MATKKPAKESETKTSRLVILDTHAILHRAYHAIPDLSTSQGEPTGALFGLISTILKIMQDLKPEYLIATRDLPGKTVRHEQFEAYKATRAKTDEALIQQLKKAPEVLDALGIPTYCLEGFEADDMIGTVVRELSARRDIDIVIASGDMDTLQLVNDKRVQVYTMRKGLTDTVLYDDEAVRERYGFGPERVVDYKALRGDPSDNIPGIRGIGEKTATDLIAAFGSLEDIYQTLATKPASFEKAGIKARIVQLLKDGKEPAVFSKQLATIHTNAPIHFELPARHWHLSDHLESAATLCDALEFRSLKERIRTLSGARSEPEEEKQLEEQDIDPETLTETSVALWLLHSDISDPSLEDILQAANTDDFEKARAAIFAELRQTGKLQELFDTIEKPLIPVVERMNKAGVYLDVAQLKALSREYTKHLGDLAEKIYKTVGHEFNINSPKQLATVLYDELKLGEGMKQKKTATGARTTKESELEKMAEGNPIVADVLDFRELQKLLGTYIDKMQALVDKESRLHTRFIQAGTTTGRMSSEDPNLQNIPIKTENGQRIRSAFAAPKGRLIAALDYSQIELRIAAGLSGDEKLVEVFKKGGDVHTAVAADVFGVPRDLVDKEMRRRAKVINFGILYGMGVNALKANLGAGVSRDEAARYLDEYFKQYAGLARFVERTKLSAERLGYTETMFGRRRYFPGLKSTLPGMRAQAERMAVNAPMQGTQSDIIKMAMVEADTLIEKNNWREKTSLVMQVHDELVYEVDAKAGEEIARAIRHMMEKVAPEKMLSGVPIIAEASIGPNWNETKRLPR